MKIVTLAERTADCHVDLKEIAHFFGGWNELRKVIDQLEQNDNESAGERSQNEPEAFKGGFADNY